MSELLKKYGKQAAEAKGEKPDTTDATIDTISINCVLGGVLMDIGFTSLSIPELLERIDAIKAADPGVQFRSSFPAKGTWGGGNAKEASVSTVMADFGKFTKITLLTPEDDKGDEISIMLSKDKAASVIDDLTAVGIDEKAISKLARAKAAGKSVMVTLDPALKVSYSEGKDGTCWLKEYLKGGV